MLSPGIKYASFKVAAAAADDDDDDCDDFPLLTLVETSNHERN
jgi:hypothetical protein